MNQKDFVEVGMKFSEGTCAANLVLSFTLVVVSLAGTKGASIFLFIVVLLVE